MDISQITIRLFPEWALSLAALLAGLGWGYWYRRGRPLTILRGFALAFAVPLLWFAIFDLLVGYSNMETIQLAALSRTARALYYTITIIFHILAYKWRDVTDDYR